MNWYTTEFNSSTRHSSRVRGQSAFQSLESTGLYDENSTLSDGVDGNMDDTVATFPRSVLDLMEMNKSAKVAKWGNEEESDDDVDSQNIPIQSENDSEDGGDSDETSESDSDGSFNATSSNTYEYYFGKSSALASQLDRTIMDVWEPRGRRKRSFSNSRRPRGASFVGPSTSVDATVFLTDEAQAIVVNGQCPELADKWILGPWKDSSRLMTVQPVEALQESKVVQDFQSDGECSNVM